MTRKIRLLSLATTYPDSVDSTKPRFVHLLNKELVKLGIDVLTICPHSKNSTNSKVIEGVNIKRFRYLPKRFEQSTTTSIPDEIRSKTGFFKVVIMITSFFFSTLFSCLKNRPDIVHGQWAFPGGYIAYLMTKIFSTKSIVTVHYAEIPLLEKFNFIRKRVVHGLNNSKVIAVSYNTKRKLVKLGVKEEVITVIGSAPNFVPHISDMKYLNKFRIKFAAPDYKIILFCGRLVEHKGVAYLIQSILKIKTKNIHLVVVGDGIMKKELQKLINNLGLNEKITLYGSATHEELGWIHDISDIFVCPSIIDSRGNTEGLGLVILEAMESGMPVVASSVGGIVDIIIDKKNGLLVPEKDPDSIAKAINDIFTNTELKDKIINNSKDTVKKFSPQIIAKQHVEIFDILLDKHQREI